MKAFEFTLGVLAVWRMTHLLVAEDGPFKLFASLRRMAGAGFLGELLDCFYCLSVWMAVPFAILWGDSWRNRTLLWLALSGAAILLNRIIDRVAPDPPVYFEEPPANIKEEA